jgi:chromosome segregation ATPase
MTHPSSFFPDTLDQIRQQRVADWQETTRELEGYRRIKDATAASLNQVAESIARYDETVERINRDTIALQGEFAQRAANMRTIRQVVDRNGEALDRQGEALARNGGALDRQGEALDRQGKALVRIDQALDRQGEALARNDEALARNHGASSRQDRALSVLETNLARLEQSNTTTPTPADSSNSVIGGLVQGIGGGLAAIKRFFFRLIESIKKLFSS